jgi:putative endonuclease
MFQPRHRGLTNHASGVAAENAACAALLADGWTIQARRLRTKAGEVDVVAEKAGILRSSRSSAGRPWPRPLPV